jgi:hypothetical protein
MKATGQVPLRFLHSLSANFTLPIRKKPMATTLLPFSLKKVSAQDLDRVSGPRAQAR